MTEFIKPGEPVRVIDKSGEEMENVARWINAHLSGGRLQTGYNLEATELTAKMPQTSTLGA